MASLLLSPEFWVLVAFVIFALFLAWKVLRPVLKGLDDRAARIRGELDGALRLREEAQHLLAEYKRKQRTAADEAKEMLSHAEEEARRLADQAARDLEGALARREAQALDRIAHAESQALDEVRSMAVDLAIAAAGKLIAKKVDEKKAAKLIDAAAKELPEKLH